MQSDYSFYKPYTLLTYNSARAISSTSFPVLEEDTLGVIRFVIDTTGGTGTKAYRFVAVTAGSAAVAAGAPVVYTDAYKTTVDTRYAQSTVNQCAGVGIGAIAAGNRGWIQIYGATTLTLGAAVAALQGQPCILDAATADGTVNIIAVGTAITYKPIAWCTAAGTGAGGTVAAFLELL